MEQLEILNKEAPVIMVDDSEDDIFITRTCYEDSRLENPFVAMTSGQEFMLYLQRVAEGAAPMPALVLLDINMPGLSGFDVLVKVREQPEFQAIPIIMMFTNSDDPADIEKAVSLGANGYQTKPDDIAEFRQFLNSLA